MKLHEMTDEELSLATQAAWKALREIIVDWQRLAKEQARRDAVKNRSQRHEWA